jgi:hypothetical protein
MINYSLGHLKINNTHLNKYILSPTNYIVFILTNLFYPVYSLVTLVKYEASDSVFNAKY